MSQIRSSSAGSFSNRSQVSRSFSSSGGGGYGFGGGINQAYGQSLMAGSVHSGAGIGVGSGFGLGSGVGFGIGSGFGMGAVSGRSVSSGLRMVGGSISAGGGGGSLSAGLKMGGGGAFVQNMAYIVNDKQQLQVLNDRLATYLEKVKRLEITNRELNEKLRSFTVNRVQTTHDLEPYQMQLRPLREKILTLIQENTELTLAIDNAKLAAEDFRLKYETEFGICQSVEGDIANLKALKKEYNATSDVLLHEVNTFEVELKNIKDAHQQEMIGLRGQIAGTVTVDVQNVESADLSRVLAEIRAEYETVIEKNRREAEHWYTKQVEKKSAEFAIVTETAVTGGTEITENRKQSMTLHTQLDAAFVEKSNLEQRLLEVQSQYQSQLYRLSQLAGSLEGELMSVRESALQQSRDYQLLLSTKVQLEREINTYKALLEGAGEVTVLAARPKTLEVKETVTVVDSSVELSTEELMTEVESQGGSNASFLITGEQSGGVTLTGLSTEVLTTEFGSQGESGASFLITGDQSGGVTLTGVSTEVLTTEFESQGDSNASFLITGDQSGGVTLTGVNTEVLTTEFGSQGGFTISSAQSGEISAAEVTAQVDF
ncbi:keratin, type I cytoskeletal 47 kDa-like isoform X2 [Triplophysa rosa]|uniref:keratin, type I cytoskeletal 47 kDa-like isoform X2 n=1 Tax=Triplophysa rosa TaxID=992332 RepID=UPI0025463645|nr:keratin, type I cytoskeletal 47 kDa-like isoform X2 [Triplophysa rosa]